MDTHEEHLKLMVKGSETRFLDYKKLLESTFKSKAEFVDADWYKDLLRESKNSEEIRLKELRQEITDLRQGLNPEYCYPKYKKQELPN